MNRKLKKDPLAVFYIIVGVIIFLFSVAEFVFRVLFAGLSLLLINYGLEVLTGKTLVELFDKGQGRR